MLTDINDQTDSPHMPVGENTCGNHLSSGINAGNSGKKEHVANGEGLICISLSSNASLAPQTADTIQPAIPISLRTQNLGLTKPTRADSIIPNTATRMYTHITHGSYSMTY